MLPTGCASCFVFQLKVFQLHYFFKKILILSLSPPPLFLSLMHTNTHKHVFLWTTLINTIIIPLNLSHASSSPCAVMTILTDGDAFHGFPDRIFSRGSPSPSSRDTLGLGCMPKTTQTDSTSQMAGMEIQVAGLAVKSERTLVK